MAPIQVIFGRYKGWHNDSDTSEDDHQSPDSSLAHLGDANSSRWPPQSTSHQTPLRNSLPCGNEQETVAINDIIQCRRLRRRHLCLPSPREFDIASFYYICKIWKFAPGYPLQFISVLEQVEKLTFHMEKRKWRSPAHRQCSVRQRVDEWRMRMIMICGFECSQIQADGEILVWKRPGRRYYKLPGWMPIGGLRFSGSVELFWEGWNWEVNRNIQANENAKENEMVKEKETRCTAKSWKLGGKNWLRTRLLCGGWSLSRMARS